LNQLFQRTSVVVASNRLKDLTVQFAKFCLEAIYAFLRIDALGEQKDASAVKKRNGKIGVRSTSIESYRRGCLLDNV
jgi:hypothetical protein